jgi:cyclophilin family peptidyl-prolyl cis-trans isomerase/HEAT repeat protein
MRIRLVASVLVAGLWGCTTVPPAVVPIGPPPPTAQQKLEWAFSLEDERRIRGEAEGQDLLVLLADPLAHIRRRAAQALGRVRATEAIDPLGAMLTAEPDPEVRQMAAFALGLIGDERAVGTLTTALSADDVVLQGRAAEALGLIGHLASAPAVASMVRRHVEAGVLDGIPPDDLGYPRVPEVEAVRLGVYALARLSAYEALASAVVHPDGTPRSQWWPVAYAVQRTADPRSAPVLVRLLTADGQITRSFAAKGLGGIRHVAARASLMTLATDTAQPVPVRVEAIRALARIRDGIDAAPLLALLTRGVTPPVLQHEVVVALGQLRARTAVDVCYDLVSADAPAMRAAALTTLAQIDADAFFTVLSSLDADSHWSVRAAVATALGTLGAERAEARLTAMLSDSDARVVPAVITALAAAKAPSAADVARSRLASEDPVIRMAAARALATLASSAAVPALREALVRADTDTTYVARAAMLEALHTLDGAQAADVLTTALGDRDWAVRVKAAALLRTQQPGTPAAPVTPAPVSTMPELTDLNALLRPAVTPTAYLDTTQGSLQIELAVVDAPRTVAHFTALVRQGFYTNVPWHRVIPDFVAQAGDPRGDGEGGPGFTMRDELNQRPFLRGTVGIALDWADTGGSQFFITHTPQPHLDARYPVFGQVIGGMDVVDRLQPWDSIQRIRIWDGVRWIGADP